MAYLEKKTKNKRAIDCEGGDETYDSNKKYEDDEKEKLLCFDCYEKSWDKPKCCGCFPYEAGLRIVMILLMFEFLGTIYLILFNREDTYNI